MAAKKKKETWAMFLFRWSWIPGTLLAIATLWGVLGFPMIATSGDIQRLTRGQAESAVEIYSTKQRSLLVIAPPRNTPAYEAWRIEIETTRRQLEAAERRKIELSR